MQSPDYKVQKDGAAGRGEGELWATQEQLRSTQAELGWLRGGQTGVKGGTELQWYRRGWGAEIGVLQRYMAKIV